MPNSIPSSRLYIPPACIRASGSFKCFATVWCHPCTLCDWSFLVKLVSLYLASVNLLLPTVNSTFQLFNVFSLKFMSLSDILYILMQLLCSIVGPYHMYFCSQSRPWLNFSFWFCSRWVYADRFRVTLPCLWLFWGILFVPQGTIRCLLTSSKYLPFIFQFFTSSVINLTSSTGIHREGRTHKRCTLMDPHTWPCKSRTTSTNIHSAAMWGYGMLSWRPT